MPTKDVDVSELAKNLHVPRFAVDDLDCVNLRAWQLRALCSAVIEQDALIAKAVASERERCAKIANAHGTSSGQRIAEAIRSSQR